MDYSFIKNEVSALIAVLQTAIILVAVLKIMLKWHDITDRADGKIWAVKKIIKTAVMVGLVQIVSVVISVLRGA